MEIEEKVEYMQKMMEDTAIDFDTAQIYLNFAKQKLINHIYPFRNDVVELESKYDFEQIELAIVLFNRKGGEGEEYHKENGVDRRFRTEAQILASIPKFAGLPK